MGEFRRETAAEKNGLKPRKLAGPRICDQQWSWQAFVPDCSTEISCCTMSGRAVVRACELTGQAAPLARRTRPGTGDCCPESGRGREGLWAKARRKPKARVKIWVAQIQSPAIEDGVAAKREVQNAKILNTTVPRNIVDSKFQAQRLQVNSRKAYAQVGACRRVKDSTSFTCKLDHGH